MICRFAILLCLAAVGSAGEARAADDPGRYPEAIEVYRCGFGPETDPNHDGWPSDWVRLKDAKHPSYLPIGLSGEPGPDGDGALLVELDGGAATVYGPPVEIDAQYAYVLEALIRTEGIVHDEAFLTLSFQDDAGERIDVVVSPKLRQTDGWQRVLLGPVVPPQRGALRAVIGLNVEPVDGQDIRGKVWFDDLWLARMPRIDLTTNDRHNLFADPAAVQLHCRVSGVGAVTPALKLEVRDPFGRLVDEAFLDVDQQVKSQRSDPQAAPSVDAGARSVTWRPEKLGFGFYRVSGSLVAADREVHERSLTLAVLRPQQLTQRGEFGWSFPAGIAPLDGPRAVELLRQSGVNWVKLPLWFASNEADRFDETVWLVDRLNGLGIRTVGLLATPPADVMKALQLPGSRATVLFGRDPAEWFPAFEPTLLRLALRVPQWQLGGDDEDYFVETDDLEPQVAAIKAQMDRVTHDVGLAIGWQWLHDSPGSSEVPWRALSLSADPELTAAELSEYLSLPKPSGAARWINLSPLPAADYALSDRLRDLALRMSAAKIHGADRIFHPDPYDAQTGLLDASASPTEMYLPWRTLAMALSGASYVGSVSLPQGSQNHVFARQDRAVMLVWNAKAVEETLYLGEQIEQRDLWGERINTGGDGQAQTIQVGPLPTLVMGMNEGVSRTQASFELEADRLPSVLGVPHRAFLRVRNEFPQRLNGSIHVTGPEAWRVSPRRVEISLGPGEEVRRPIDLTLSYDAETGVAPIRFDFDVNAGRNYQFSAFRTLEVGAGDVHVDLSSRLNARGELEVEQRLENRTPLAVRFKCDLFAPGRRHQRATLAQHGPGTATRVFYFPDGQSLIGQTLRMRASELGGARVFNVRIVAAP